MAGSSISRGTNKRRAETAEISQKKPRTASERSPIGKVKKVEPPPWPQGLRSTVSNSLPYSVTTKEKRMSSTSHLDHIHVDDIYHEDNDFLYAQDLQLQEALIYSASQINASSSSSPFSEEPDSFCGICMDNKASSEMFRNEKVCSHLFCLDCIGRHVSTKIKENIAKVRCPDPKCKGVIGPELCGSFVPKEVLERWEDALCESLILETEKFYCPFKDCSAMLVDDGGKAVTSSECPNCNRLFCARCKVAWHSGMDCREFKKLKKDERNPEDIMLMNLAKNKKWRRCPSCKFFVEKRSGCDSIRCRCGVRFWYCSGLPEW